MYKILPGYELKIGGWIIQNIGLYAITIKQEDTWSYSATGHAKLEYCMIKVNPEATDIKVYQTT